MQWTCDRRGLIDATESWICGVPEVRSRAAPGRYLAAARGPATLSARECDGCAATIAHFPIIGLCAVIVKPSELGSLQTQVLVEALIEAGLPKGLLNVVTGRGEVVAAELVRNPDVDKISFTGSVSAKSETHLRIPNAQTFETRRAGTIGVASTVGWIVK